MRPPTGICVSVWRVRQWTRMFRMTSCFAAGPEILLWWVGSLIPTPTTRPTLPVGALIARLRWTPLVRFEAPLGLFPPWDVSFFSSRALRGAVLPLCKVLQCAFGCCFCWFCILPQSPLVTPMCGWPLQCSALATPPFKVFINIESRLCFGAHGF